MNLSEKTGLIASEATEWVSGNGVDILIALGAGILIALALLALRGFGHKLIRDRGHGINWRIIAGRVLAKTTLFFIVTCAADLVAEHAATPPFLLRTINILFVVAAAFQAAIWGRELILGLVEHRVGPEDEKTTLGSAVGIIRLLVTVALFAIAIILILSNVGVDVTGLVAGLGIGGIAIGLAAQGIFKDLFAALSIIFDKPFRRGDGVKVDQVTGTVEQIGLKSTRIRSLSGEQVVVSNANLLEKELHNYANLEHRRIALPFGIVYQTQPELCARVPEIVGGVVAAHARTTLVRCGLTGFGASSLDYELQFDVHSADYEEVFATRHAICVALLAAFDAAGVAFAYPTQTSFTAAPDGSFVLPYPPAGARTEEKHTSRDGI